MARLKYSESSCIKKVLHFVRRITKLHVVISHLRINNSRKADDEGYLSTENNLFDAIRCSWLSNFDVPCTLKAGKSKCYVATKSINHLLGEVLALVSVMEADGFASYTSKHDQMQTPLTISWKEKHQTTNPANDGHQLMYQIPWQIDRHCAESIQLHVTTSKTMGEWRGPELTDIFV